MRKLHRIPPAPEIMAQTYTEHLQLGRDQGLTFPQYPLAASGY